MHGFPQKLRDGINVCINKKLYSLNQIFADSYNCYKKNETE